MSKTLPQVAHNPGLAGLRILDTVRLAMGLREKCPTCRWHNKGNCAIANAVLKACPERDIPVFVPPQLRYDDAGRPICSVFRHIEEERLGIENAKNATGKLF